MWNIFLILLHPHVLWHFSSSILVLIKHKFILIYDSKSRKLTGTAGFLCLCEGTGSINHMILLTFVLGAPKLRRQTSNVNWNMFPAQKIRKNSRCLQTSKSDVWHHSSTTENIITNTGLRFWYRYNLKYYVSCTVYCNIIIRYKPKKCTF